MNIDEREIKKMRSLLDDYSGTTGGHSQATEIGSFDNTNSLGSCVFEGCRNTCRGTCVQLGCKSKLV